MLGVKTYCIQKTVDSVTSFVLSLIQAVDVQSLSYYLSNRHSGVQRSGRILEDDLHLAPEGQHVDLCFGSAVEDGNIVVDDFSGCGLVKPDDCSSESCLSAA